MIGLAFNKNDHLVTVDVSRNGPPAVCVFKQDGTLVNRGQIVDDPMTPGSKLRFVECIDDNVFIVDLGIALVHFD